jgi:hypothetical protein
MAYIFIYFKDGYVNTEEYTEQGIKILAHFEHTMVANVPSGMRAETKAKFQQIPLLRDFPIALYNSFRQSDLNEDWQLDRREYTAYIAKIIKMWTLGFTIN